MQKTMTAVGALALLLGGCEMLPADETSTQSVSQTLPSGAELVSNKDAFETAMRDAQPGDTIILADGVWRDFDMVIDANGSAAAPLTITTETKGSVILSGQSSLRISGDHVVVSGLVFKDGYSPRNEVVSFRTDRGSLANNSRVTEIVIDDFSNPIRSQRDLWVAIYGKNNRFDHNHLSGKLNAGPTLAVRLNSEDSQNNGHRIDHNYFGPRAVFGSNGGETLRIGTSHFSLTTSNTTVEKNFFDRCSGEVEIASNKSGGNTFRGNTFFESRGTLTLRHGSETTVEKNLFDGNGALYTGGVRVINPRQTISDNYFKDLTGNRFSGGLVVMNGVPNSPINRYHQVDGAVIENNVFENIDAIELGEGSDKERTAVPINTAFKNNTFVNADRDNPFNLYDDMSGIDFDNNIASQDVPNSLSSGFRIDPSANISPDPSDYGVSREVTGVTWYPKAPYGSPFDGEQVIDVPPGENTIADALKTAEPGATLLLSSGNYNQATIIKLDIPVTIATKTGESQPLLSFERPNMFMLSGKGGLRLKNVSATGARAPDGKGNSFITTSPHGGGSNHTVEIYDSNFSDFKINRNFSIVKAEKGTFYDKVYAKGSSFEDVSGTVFKFDAEKDDFGIYNAEFVVVEESSFKNVGESVLNLYRGGRDESTFGPHAYFTGSNFYNVGKDGSPLMILHGVQHVKIQSNAMTNTGPVDFTITTGLPEPIVSNNRIAGPVISTTDLR